MRMNGFVRQLAALATLWALCELLLPRRREMVQLAASLMVMAALVMSLGEFLGYVRQSDWPVFSAAQPAQRVTGYQRIALTSLANQLEQLCLRMARQAGYDAQAVVYLRPDGALEKVELYLRRKDHPPLLDESSLMDAMAGKLSLSRECISWQPLNGEAMP